MKPYGTEGTKKEEVRQMFDRIAPAYDRLNHLLSFNMDRVWRRKTIRMAARTNPSDVIDLATGTGDLAIGMARRMPNARIAGIDLSQGMVEIGKQKVENRGLSGQVHLEVGDGEALQCDSESFDCATIAFGIRNYQNIEKGLSEFVRVLRPGGTALILEFSTPRGKIFGPLYRFYFHNVLPRIGGLVSKDRSAYTYLPGSVDEFPASDRFLDMMHSAGFKKCTSRRLMRGIAYIYTGIK